MITAFGPAPNTYVRLALNPLNMNFGQMVQEHRERRGWTQQQLADEAGVSKATISRIESGDRGGSPDTFNKLRDTLALPHKESAIAWAAQRGNTSVQSELETSSITEEIRRYVEEDPQLLAGLRFLHGMPPDMRAGAIGALEGMKSTSDKRLKTAADVIKEEEDARTIAKRADREENPGIDARLKEFFDD